MKEDALLTSSDAREGASGSDALFAFRPLDGQAKQWAVSPEMPADFTVQFPEYSRPILQLLYNRGLRTQREINEFFDAEYSVDIHDPFLFKDMARAVERIWNAIGKKEKIIVYGDYDADGICGSVILCTTLKKLGADVDVYIPNRFVEGYGLQEKAIGEITKDKKVKLVITVDCGITDVHEVEVLKKAGCDVIITDHHLPPPQPPEAYAIINPKSEGEAYPFTLLCGAGVAFKLACALLKDEHAQGIDTAKEGMEKWLLDMVAIATIADMVPLIGENRTLVKYGLIVIRKTQRVGLRTLFALRPARALEHIPFPIPAEMVTAETIAFSIAPRINATSRMDHATISFELLVTEREENAQTLAEHVEALNNERRRTIDQIMKEAEVVIARESEALGKTPDVIFAGHEDWAVGVVGLVAGRLTEKYGRPSFIYGKANGAMKGSCRGIEGFHVVEAMRACAEGEQGLLGEFGGHPMAGGFAVPESNVEKFKACIREYAMRVLPKDIPPPMLAVDAEIAPDEITWEVCDQLARFEPFGVGNRKPLFVLRGAGVASMRTVGEKESHLKLKVKTVRADGSVKFFDCIGFGLSGRMEYFTAGDRVDLVFELETNEWNGTKELQIKIKDIRKAL